MGNVKLVDSRVEWTGDGETVVVEPWGEDSLRVRASLGSPVRDHRWALLDPEPSSATVEQEGSTVWLRNGKISAKIETSQHFDAQRGYSVAECRLSFHDAQGNLLTKEMSSGGALKLKARRYQPIVGGDYRLAVSFESDPKEKLVGMGLYQQDLLDLKGSGLELAHRNSQASVPFVVSSQGYGFLWHNPAVGAANFGTNRTLWESESASQIDYWITAAPTMKEITEAYATAVGKPGVMPEYGLGLWQSKLRYQNQDELVAVAREYQKRNLPVDVVVADFFHWPYMGDYRFETEFWPDPSKMVRDVADAGSNVMVSVWPQVSVDSENFDEMRANNYLVTTDRGLAPQMAFEGPSLFVDVTNPAARKYLWELCKRNYYDHGISIFWLDEAEPEYGVYDFDNYRYYAGPGAQVTNLYPQLFTRTFYDGMREEGQEEIVSLVRSAWAGSQRYGALVWSGDIACSWEALRRQVVAGLHLGMAGIPWFTTDIGGFIGGDPNDDAFRELLIRWFQFATFSPVLRMHGDRRPSTPVTASDGSRRSPSGAPNELWSFGEDAYGILTRFLFLRERLRPYTRKLMDEAHEHGYPLLRGLYYEFPDDPGAWDPADEYMFGPDLLVAPTMQAGKTTRRVYLPAGTDWVDLNSGQRLAGGQWVEAHTPLDTIAVYCRASASDALGDLFSR